jgi:hypothetical protein
MPTSLKITVGAIPVAGRTTSSARDPAGLLHGGQLEFLLGAEVRVQAARAHPGRRVQSKG